MRPAKATANAFESARVKSLRPEWSILVLSVARDSPCFTQPGCGAEKRQRCESLGIRATAFPANCPRKYHRKVHSDATQNSARLDEVDANRASNVTSRAQVRAPQRKFDGSGGTAAFEELGCDPAEPPSSTGSTAKPAAIIKISAAIFRWKKPKEREWVGFWRAGRASCAVESF